MSSSTAPDRIVVIGFMGAGKSTVGRMLADRLGWRFLDLDRCIEERTGHSVPQLFALFGEEEFRRLESEALRDLLQQQHVVIATGGGCIETAANREMLISVHATATVYLAAPFATLYQRCMDQAADPAATARPNLMVKTQAEERFARRQQHYARLATHTIDTAEKTAEKTAAAILAELHIGATNPPADLAKP